MYFQFRRIRKAGLADFIDLPIPASALRNVDDATIVDTSRPPSANYPVPQNMLPSLPDTTPTGAYITVDQWRAWDGSNQTSGCPNPDGAVPGCCPQGVVVPSNNNLSMGNAVMTQDQLNEMLPGGSLAARPVGIPSKPGVALSTSGGVIPIGDINTNIMVTPDNVAVVSNMLPGGYSGGLPVTPSMLSGLGDGSDLAQKWWITGAVLAVLYWITKR